MIRDKLLADNEESHFLTDMEVKSLVAFKASISWAQKIKHRAGWRRATTHPDSTSDFVNNITMNDTNDNLPKSSLFRTFLVCNPDLQKEIANFFDELFLNGFQEPWSIGQKIIVSLDAPYWRHHQASVDRIGYIRQNFSIEFDSISTHNEKTVFRFSYGTGCGLTTHGIAKK